VKKEKSNQSSSENDNSSRAFQELIRVLEGAVQAGVSTIGLEYKGGDLRVFFQSGPIGFGAGCISKDLQQAVINELVERAKLKRKSRGKFPVTLLGNDFQAIVEEYDSFGESAYSLNLMEPN